MLQLPRYKIFSNDLVIATSLSTCEMNELRTYETFKQSLRCYDWLPDAVSGASDLDLCIERRGAVLVIEAKPREGPRVYVPFGQLDSLKTLASKPDVTVWLVAEDSQAKADAVLPRYSVLSITSNTKPHAGGLRNNQRHAVFFTDRSFTHCTLNGLKSLVRDWWAAQ